MAWAYIWKIFSPSLWEKHITYVIWGRKKKKGTRKIRKIKKKAKRVREVKYWCFEGGGTNVFAADEVGGVYGFWTDIPDILYRPLSWS
jgi:hypothetical protein